MKLINPKAEYLPQASGLEGIYKQIKLAGRTCYKSEDKITENSAKPFVDRMIKSGHGAMTEHGTVYLYLEINPENTFSKFEYPLAQFTVPYNWSDVVRSIRARHRSNPYSKVESKTEVSKTEKGYTKVVRKIFITTNYRTIIENGWQDDLQFICSPTEFHEKRYTFRLTTSIGVTREILRHRHFSFAEMSTRYCNFSKNKFGNEITFCIPKWMSIEDNSHFSYDEDIDRWQSSEDAVTSNFLQSIAFAEKNYLTQIRNGWQPQQAREVLPLCTASEIVVTGFSGDFRHFFDLRLFGKTGRAHPNMQRLAELMKAEAEKAGIWNDIMSKQSKFE